MKNYWSLPFILSFLFSAQLMGQSAEDIILKSISKMKAIKTVSFEMKSVERFEDEYMSSHSKVKTQFYPYKVYIQAITEDGNRGPEVLYHATDENALISPNKFPYINLPVKPSSFILRNGHHHTLEQNVFTFLASVMENEINKVGKENLAALLNKSSDTLVNGIECHRVTVNWPKYAWEPYTVKLNESFTSIAKKLVMCDTHILQKNAGYSGYEDLKEGDKILVPTHYASAVVFLINKKNWMPQFIRIKDEKGLFASYSFKKISVNPPFTALDFSKENDTYNFKY